MPWMVDGDLHPDLLLLVGREDVDHAVDGLRAVLGVQSGEDKVAGLCCRERGLDGLEVAHLPHEDDVRVLAQDRFEGPLNDLVSVPTSRWLTMHFL